MRCVRLMLRIQNALIGKLHEQRVLFAIGHVLLPESLVSGRSSLGKIFYLRLALSIDTGLDRIPGERGGCHTHRHEELEGLHDWAPSLNGDSAKTSYDLYVELIPLSLNILCNPPNPPILLQRLIENKSQSDSRLLKLQVSSRCSNFNVICSKMIGVSVGQRTINHLLGQG